ncbi:MAG TPA: hypothetical protein VLT86_15440 [Vicinamibacterales bacterium]|nr:hypothetical protein [Vicinamibacterales bacterium]
MRRLLFALALAGAAVAGTDAQSRAPVVYRVTFPAAEHHWVQVDVTWSGLGTAPLQARMSRSSPGRYAVHEFAKNVFSVEAFNSRGQKLAYTRPNVDEWDVAGHDGTVRIIYKLFGDYADGTYLGVDTTHGHLNMPATFMWATGHDNDAMRVTFVPPDGSNWRVGTQLYTTEDPFTFTAPNLQYFMDSPTELSDFVLSQFSVPNADGTPARFRLVVHGDGSQADVDELAKLVDRLVREQMAVYGEFPKYEPGYYTFLLDYAPWGDGDGMEHRNSTSISSPGLSIRTPQGRQRALGTISHEFFHNWNVERIRPVGLEPFDFTRENITCCLWLAEGFTQYYGPLLLTRAGLIVNPPVNAGNAIITGPGRTVRSAVQMSEYGPFADAARSVDATDRSRTFISYYSYGAALALALDLSLREMSNGKQSLDDYMRLLWTKHGKPGGPAPGLVGKPYSLKDIRDLLAELTGNRSFADGFFDKYVEGRDVPDYATLLRGIGYVLRPARPDAGWIGNVQVQEVADGLRVGVVPAGGGDANVFPVAFDTPLYKAGVDEDDVITQIDGQAPTLAAWRAIAQRRPGDRITLVVKRRDGKLVTTTATLQADPAVQVAPVENTGGVLTDAQKALRDGWLASRAK